MNWMASMPYGAASGTVWGEQTRRRAEQEEQIRYGLAVVRYGGNEEAEGGEGIEGVAAGGS